ncbi:mannose-1-phosphate guanylyltransferase/mannose-6-phosphate isomerase [Sporosarcina luteola]|nr:mannose-1-phosphate guanylyltransferase/mannose-6-phosphate isomerase [Sporosarcina luteola]
MELQLYTLDFNSSILQALEQIEKNKKGFVIIHENMKVRGTITDGDIRRAIISGYSVDQPIKKLLLEDFTFISQESTFDTVIDLFKSSKINFLPILKQNGELLNILTKDQLHSILLEDIQWDLNYDFTTLDQKTINQEIYNRPWGYYKTVFLSDYSRVKIIKVNPGEELSLQEHKKREEHWVIVKGKGEITVGESMKSVDEGSYIFIPKGCKHRIKNNSHNSSLMISEVQLGSYFEEDDIIRYLDKYGRV